MNVKVITPSNEEGFLREIDERTTAEDLAKTYGDEMPYRILAAKIDNKMVGLNTVIFDEIKEYERDLHQIELLDMRTQGVNLIYENTLCFIYLKAVEEVFAPFRVEIQHAINKGVYSIIRRQPSLLANEIEEIGKKMQELIDQDIKIENLGNDQYSLNGYIDSFKTPMLPSTGYVEHFSIRRYRRGVLLRMPQPKLPNVVPEYEDEVKLYEVFREATNWCKLMEVSHVKDLNQKVKDGTYKELIYMSEALHEKKIVELANTIKNERKRIILIAGPSSSGKTTFANRLLIQLKVIGLKPIYLGTDDYFINREFTPLDENGEKNFEDLEALDLDLFNKHMNSLLAGEEVDLPRYDFKEGVKKFGERIIKINSEQPIVIEGIHALNQHMTELVSDEEKFRIYISPLTQLNIDIHNRISTTDSRMLRRIVRDYKFRGYSATNTINSWPKVRAGEEKNIFPYSNEADAMFNSVHLYEISVLKKYALPLLQEIKREEPEYCEAQRMLKFLSHFETIEDDSMIANNSIIREFIGGSVLV